MQKFVMAACALGLLSGSALAQKATTPPPPAGPTDVQCQQGWKQGMKWTKDQFQQACMKMKDSKKQ